MAEDNLIELEDENGNLIKCALFDIIDFEGKQYALLSSVSEDGGKDDDPELTIVQYTEEDGNAYFETIEDDEEFERISDYIDNLYDEETDDEE